MLWMNLFHGLRFSCNGRQGIVFLKTGLLSARQDMFFGHGLNTTRTN